MKNLLDDSDEEKYSFVQSMEVDYKRIDLKAEYQQTLPTQDGKIGFVLMLWYVLSLTLFHLFAKIAFINNPNITNFDWLLFCGMMMTPTYIIISKYKREPINILEYSPPAVRFFTISIFLALSVNILMLYGISLIPVGKSILVLSLNPIFLIILAYIFLGEKELPIFSTLGAFIGIYLVSLNKPVNEESEDNIIGFIWVFVWAWLQALINISVRILNIYQVHPFLRPIYIGAWYLILTISMMGLSPSIMAFPDYELLDIVLLWLSGLGATMFHVFLNYAFRYQKASKLAPMYYLEDMFTLLADAFIFGYSFVDSDYTGILIIAFCVLTPTVKDYLDDK